MFQFKWMLGKMKGYRAVYAVALCLSVVIQSFFLTGPMIVEQISVEHVGLLGASACE